MEAKKTAAGTARARLTFAAHSAAVARITFAAAKPDAAAADALTIGVLTGYPIVFNTLSTDRGGYVVRLMPGSANFTTPTLALFNHSSSRLLGNSQAKTLRILPADDYGIPVEIDLPNDADGRKVAIGAARGDIAGMSFAMCYGFEQSFGTSENGVNILNVTKFTVDEVSAISDPAFLDATCELTDTLDMTQFKKIQTAPRVYGDRATQAAQLARLKLAMLKL